MSYKKENPPSIGDLIVTTLMSHRSSASFHKILREREFARYKEKSVQMTLSRLRKRGYLDNNEGSWFLTPKGKSYGNNTYLFSYIASPFNKNQQASTIVSFDISEADRAKRNWLRNQIKIFGYKMLQQSLWLGPGPLPADFLKRLGELDIRKNVKIFSVKKKNI